MKEKPDFNQELASIRTLMERSSKFISLSGLSGVLAGLYAMIGAAYAYFVLYDTESIRTVDYYNRHPDLVFRLGVVAAIVLIASLVTGWYLSYRKATKEAASMWNITSKTLLVNLAIPLAAGGIFILILLLRQYYGIVAPSLLLFYGLALINASNNLYDEVRYLGYTEIALGLIAALLPGYGLLFWTIGFGVLHVFYGALMYNKYERR